MLRENEDLHWIRDAKIRIGYLSCDNDKKLPGERLVYGECRKVPDLYRAYIPYDFLVIFYWPNVSLMTDEQQEILMHHELLHVGMEPSGKLYVVPHDIEDFYSIIEKHGLDWCGLKAGEPDGS